MLLVRKHICTYESQHDTETKCAVVEYVSPPPRLELSNSSVVNAARALFLCLTYYAFTRNPTDCVSHSHWNIARHTLVCFAYMRAVWHLRLHVRTCCDCCAFFILTFPSNESVRIRQSKIQRRTEEASIRHKRNVPGDIRFLLRVHFSLLRLETFATECAWASPFSAKDSWKSEVNQLLVQIWNSTHDRNFAFIVREEWMCSNRTNDGRQPANRQFHTHWGVAATVSRSRMFSAFSEKCKFLVNRECEWWKLFYFANFFCCFCPGPGLLGVVASRRATENSRQSTQRHRKQSLVRHPRAHRRLTFKPTSTHRALV